MPDAILTLFTIFGWLAVIIGAVLLVWDAIMNRVLSRLGLGAVVVGVVLLVLAAVLPGPTYDSNYDGAQPAFVTAQL